MKCKFIILAILVFAFSCYCQENISSESEESDENEEESNISNSEEQEPNQTLNTSNEENNKTDSFESPNASTTMNLNNAIVLSTNIAQTTMSDLQDGKNINSTLLDKSSKPLEDLSVTKEDSSGLSGLPNQLVNEVASNISNNLMLNPEEKKVSNISHLSFNQTTISQKTDITQKINSHLPKFVLKYLIKNVLKKGLAKTKESNIKSFFRFAETNLIKHVIYSKLNGFFDKENNDCTRQMRRVLKGLKNKEDWAISMIDATGKLNAGYMNGHLSNLGHMDQCLLVKYEQDKEVISGKYCVASLRPHDERGQHYYNHFMKKLNRLDRIFSMNEHGKQVMDYFFEANVLQGICVPSACNQDTLSNLTKIIEDDIASTIQIKIFDYRCQTVDEDIKQLTMSALVTIIIFGIICLVILVSTIYDVFFNRKSNCSNVLISFSLYTNGKHLFSSKVKQSNINCLNGLRVLSMFWVLFAHRYMKVADGPVSNGYELIKWLDSGVFSAVYSGVYAVDTFFTISGFLLVFLYLKKEQEGNPLTIPLMLFQRFIRLTPLLLAVLALEFNRNYYITGPLAYRYTENYTEECRKHWWATVLYFSNYYSPLNQCIVTSWYLGADTQLYLLSPIFLLTFPKWPKVAISGLILALLSCITFNIMDTYNNNLPPLLPASDGNPQVFFNTHTRMGPWVVGAIFAYILLKHDDSKKLGKKLTCILWILVIIILFGLPLNIYLRVAKFQTYLIENAILNGLSRSLWALGICLLIFLCHKNRGGIVDSILSSPIFNVSYRVNYAMYLIHMLIIDAFMARKRNILYFEDLEIIRLAVSDYAVTLFVGIILTLTIEIPFYNLGKSFYERGKEKKSQLDTPETIKKENQIVYINAYD